MTTIIKRYDNLSATSRSLFYSSSCQYYFLPLKTVSYITKVTSIVSSNYTRYGRHGDTNTIEFKSRNYKEVMRFGSIKAGHPAASNLHETLKSLKNNIVMPKPSYNRLSDTQIELIYSWIGVGALNN